MGAAAAEVVAERLGDGGLARVRITPQQGGDGHDHPVEAVAALGALLGDEGRLDRMGVLGRAQAFERRDLPRADDADGDAAGPRRDPVDEHSASAAFAEATAIFGAVKSEIIAEDIEQRCLGHDGEPMNAAIDPKIQPPSVQTHRAPIPDRLYTYDFGGGAA